MSNTTQRLREITIIGKRWFDAINGNTYHSVTIQFDNHREDFYIPMTYGYDDNYLQTAVEGLEYLGVIRKTKYDNGNPIEVSRIFRRLKAQRGITVHTQVHDGSKLEL